ncbi:MAG: MATE family efflux transporter [Spirochaetota bacterium]|nr:MAG: MATE family efflux transporter [Spirochaetota bacterium]
MEHHQGDESTFASKEIKGMYDGPILKLLVKLSLPIFAGMVFQLLYNITDTIWISRIDLADPSYVGGTGIIFPIMFFAMAIGHGILIGVSSLVARSIGARNREVLSRTAESGLIIAIVVTVLVVVSCYIFAERIIRALGAVGDYYTHALEYFLYIIPAAALMFISNVFFGIIQGEGLMDKMMKAMIIGTLTNMVLDPVFIFLLGMKVKGAAVATDIAQVVVLIYVVSIFLRKKALVQIDWKVKNVDFSIVRQIVAIGLPQTAGQIMMSVSFLVFNRIVISIDPHALTAFSLCGRFDMVVITPIFAIASALITMVGQNYGRGNYDRVKNIWWAGMLSASAVVTFVAAIMVIFAPAIYPFFSDVDSVIRYAVLQTRIIEFSFLFATIGILARSTFQAMGYPMPAFFIPVLRLVAIAIPVVYLYVYVLNLGIYGVWFGVITANCVSAGVSLFWISRALNRLSSDGLRSNNRVVETGANE